MKIDSVEIDIDSDILNTLKEIELRNSPAYELGREDALNEVATKLKQKAKSIMKQLVSATELYYEIIKNRYPEIIVNELRIGTDYSSSMPVSLVIIPESNRENKRLLIDLGSDIELELANNKVLQDVQFWVIVDSETLDKNMLNHDFPLYRSILSED